VKLCGQSPKSNTGIRITSTQVAQMLGRMVWRAHEVISQPGETVPAKHLKLIVGRLARIHQVVLLHCPQTIQG
jgi:hypothetical protein